jgi:hypothetical protein
VSAVQAWCYAFSELRQSLAEWLIAKGLGLLDPQRNSRDVLDAASDLIVAFIAQEGDDDDL